MPKETFSKFKYKTVNMHTLCDIEPGKYNGVFRKSFEKNPALIMTNEYE